MVSDPPMSFGQALPTAMALRPHPNLQRGLDLFAAGQYAQAIQDWQGILAHGTPTPLVQALTANYLATAYQELGQWGQAEQAIEQSQAFLRRSQASVSIRSPIQARMLTTQARLDLAQGQSHRALQALHQAEQLYQQVGDHQGQWGTQLNQAQVLITLGRYRSAVKQLQQISQQLHHQPVDLAVVGYLNIGNVYQAMGDLGAAWCQLDQGLALVQDQELTALHSAFNLSLGNVAMAWGQRDQIQRHPALPPRRVGGQTANLQQLRETCASPDSFQIINELGPLLAQETQRYYRQAAQQALTPTARLTAQLQQLTAQLDELQVKPDPERLQNWQPALERWQRLWAEVLQSEQRDSPSRDRIVMLLKLVQQGMTLHQHSGAVTPAQLQDGLERAITQSIQLQDPVAQSMAYGALGHFHETQGQWSPAQAATEQALHQAAGDPSQIYQWQWQLGRIHQGMGDRQTALASYAGAIDTLQQVRPTLNTIGSGSMGNDFRRLNPDFQSYFRARIEPVYREYIDLLLPAATPTHSVHTEPEEPLLSALAAYELLQESELETLLRCNLRARSTPTDSLLPRDLQATIAQVQQKLDRIHRHSPRTAILFPIELHNRLAILLSLPDKPLMLASQTVAPEKMAQTLWNLEQALTPDYSQRLQKYRLRDRNYIMRQAQQVHDWVLGPVQSQLKSQPIEQIIAMPDGLLRDLPLSVLYDHERAAFLVESYGVAVVPSLLQAPLNRKPQPPRLLATGLTQVLHPSSQYPPLPAAQQEVTQISQRFRRRHRLTGKQFTWINVEQLLTGQQFTNLHIATHGKFSAQPQGTFLVDAQLQPLTLDRLEQFLQSQTSLSLLALSACQTAQGSYRATLGLAGVAIQSGAQNTLATLFIVPDNVAAETMEQFYALLHSGLTPVTALQQIQKNDIQRGIHPSYWSPYVVVGLGR